MRRAQRGDGPAFTRLIERHQTQVSRLMWRFSRDPEVHKDLVQEVFIEAYTSLSNYHGRAPFDHWLARVATRVGYRYWKQQRRTRRVTEAPFEDWHEGLSRPADLAPPQAGEILYQLLASLSTRDRLVLSLRYLEDCSVAETARLTGWSETMVKVQTWRARARLAKLYEKEVAENEGR